jgi:hypothetical protein
VSDQPIEALRDYETFQKSLRDFASWLNGVVPGASDVDLLIERKGRFLVCELKPWTNGVNLPYGQHLALTRLAELDVFTVYIIGESPDGLHVMNLNPGMKPITSRRKGKMVVWWEPKRFLPMTRDSLRDVVKNWWDSSSN